MRIPAFILGVACGLSAQCGDDVLMPITEPVTESGLHGCPGQLVCPEGTTGIGACVPDEYVASYVGCTDEGTRVSCCACDGDD